MIEAISASTFMTGGKMIWEGVKWIARSRQAPWSIVPLSASLEGYVAPWYSVRFFCRSDKAFAIDLLIARTIRPSNLRLKDPERGTPSEVAANTGSVVLDNLQWLIQEEPTKAVFQRSLLVNLNGLSGEIQLDVEFKARFYDSRRTEVPIWVRTNPLKLP